MEFYAAQSGMNADTDGESPLPQPRPSSTDLDQLLADIKELKQGFLGTKESDSVTHDNPTYEGSWDDSQRQLAQGRHADKLRLDVDAMDLDESLEELVARDARLQYILSPQAEEQVQNRHLGYPSPALSPAWAAPSGTTAAASSSSGLPVPASSPLTPVAAAAPQMTMATPSQGHHNSHGNASSSAHATTAPKTASRIAKPPTSVAPPRQHQHPPPATSHTTVTPPAGSRGSSYSQQHAATASASAATPHRGTGHATPVAARTSRSRTSSATTGTPSATPAGRPPRMSATGSSAASSVVTSPTSSIGGGRIGSTSGNGAAPPPFGATSARKRPPEAHAAPGPPVRRAAGPGLASPTARSGSAAAVTPSHTSAPHSKPVRTSISGAIKAPRQAAASSSTTSGVVNQQPAAMASLTSPIQQAQPSLAAAREQTVPPSFVAAAAAAMAATDGPQGDRSAVSAADALEVELSKQSLTLPNISVNTDMFAEESLEAFLAADPVMAQLVSTPPPQEPPPLPPPAASTTAFVAQSPAMSVSGRRLSPRTSDELVQPPAAAMTSGSGRDSAMSPLAGTLLEEDADAEMDALLGNEGGADWLGASAAQGVVGPAAAAVAAQLRGQATESPARSTGGGSEVVPTTPMGSTAQKVSELLGLTPPSVEGPAGDMASISSEELWRNVSREAGSMFADAQQDEGQVQQQAESAERAEPPGLSMLQQEHANAAFQLQAPPAAGSHSTGETASPSVRDPHEAAVPAGSSDIAGSGVMYSQGTGTAALMARALSMQQGPTAYALSVTASASDISSEHQTVGDASLTTGAATPHKLSGGSLHIDDVAQTEGAAVAGPSEDDDDELLAEAAAEAAAAMVGPPPPSGSPAIPATGLEARDSGSYQRLLLRESSDSSFGFDAAVAYEAQKVSRQLAGADSGRTSLRDSAFGMQDAVEEGDEDGSLASSQAALAALQEAMELPGAAARAEAEVAELPLGTGATDSDVAGGADGQRLNAGQSVSPEETTAPSVEGDAASMDAPSGNALISQGGNQADKVASGAGFAEAVTASPRAEQEVLPAGITAPALLDASHFQTNTCPPADSAAQPDPEQQMDADVSQAAEAAAGVALTESVSAPPRAEQEPLLAAITAPGLPGASHVDANTCAPTDTPAQPGPDEQMHDGVSQASGAAAGGALTESVLASLTGQKPLSAAITVPGLSNEGHVEANMCAPSDSAAQPPPDEQMHDGVSQAAGAAAGTALAESVSASSSWQRPFSAAITAPGLSSAAHVEANTCAPTDGGAHPDPDEPMHGDRSQADEVAAGAALADSVSASPRAENGPLLACSSIPGLSNPLQDEADTIAPADNLEQPHPDEPMYDAEEDGFDVTAGASEAGPGAATASVSHAVSALASADAMDCEVQEQEASQVVGLSSEAPQASPRAGVTPPHASASDTTAPASVTAASVAEMELDHRPGETAATASAGLVENAKHAALEDGEMGHAVPGTSTSGGPRAVSAVAPAAMATDAPHIPSSPREQQEAEKGVEGTDEAVTRAIVSRAIASAVAAAANLTAMASTSAPQSDQGTKQARHASPTSHPTPDAREEAGQDGAPRKRVRLSGLGTADTLLGAPSTDDVQMEALDKQSSGTDDGEVQPGGAANNAAAAAALARSAAASPPSAAIVAEAQSSAQHSEHDSDARSNASGCSPAKPEPPGARSQPLSGSVFASPEAASAVSGRWQDQGYGKAIDYIATSLRRVDPESLPSDTFSLLLDEALASRMVSVAASAPSEVPVAIADELHTSDAAGGVASALVQASAPPHVPEMEAPHVAGSASAATDAGSKDSDSATSPAAALSESPTEPTDKAAAAAEPLPRTALLPLVQAAGPAQSQPQLVESQPPAVQVPAVAVAPACSDDKPLLHAWQMLAASVGSGSGHEVDVGGEGPAAAAPSARGMLAGRTSLRSMNSSLSSSRLSRISSRRDELDSTVASPRASAAPEPPAAGASEAQDVAVAAVREQSHTPVTNAGQADVAIGITQPETPSQSLPLALLPQIRTRSPGADAEAEEQQLLPAWKVLRVSGKDSVASSPTEAVIGAAQLRESPAAESPAAESPAAAAGSLSPVAAVTGGASPSRSGGQSPLGSQRSFRAGTPTGSSRLQHSTSLSAINAVADAPGSMADAESFGHGAGANVFTSEAAAVAAATAAGVPAAAQYDSDEGGNLPPAWKVYGSPAAAAEPAPETIAAARSAPLGAQPSFRSSRTRSSRLHRSSAADAEDLSFIDGVRVGKPDAQLEEPSSARSAPGDVTSQSDGAASGPFARPPAQAQGEEADGVPPPAWKVYSPPRSGAYEGQEQVAAGRAGPLGTQPSFRSSRTGSSRLRRSSATDADDFALPEATVAAPSALQPSIRRSRSRTLPGTAPEAGPLQAMDAAAVTSPDAAVRPGASVSSGGAGPTLSSTRSLNRILPGTSTSESGGLPPMLAARISSRRLAMEPVGSVPLSRRLSHGGDPAVDAMRPAWQIFPLPASPNAPSSLTANSFSGGGVLGDSDGRGSAGNTPTAANMLASMRSSSRLSRVSSGIPEDLLAELRVQAHAAVGHLQAPPSEDGHSGNMHSHSVAFADPEEVTPAPRGSAGAHESGDGAGGVVHAWKLLQVRAPTPSVATGSNAGGSPAGIVGAVSSPVGPVPQSLLRMTSMGGRPTLGATRGSNASSRFAAASSKAPPLQVTFSPPASVPEDGSLPPRPAPMSAPAADMSAVPAWKVVSPVVPPPHPAGPEDVSGSLAGPPIGVSPAGAPPTSNRSLPLGSRPSLKSMRSGSAGGSRLSRTGSVLDDSEYVDETYAAIASPGTVLLEPPAPPLLAVVAVGAAGQPHPGRMPHATLTSIKSSELEGGQEEEGAGEGLPRASSERSSAPAAVGLPPGVLYSAGAAAASSRSVSASGTSSTRPPLTRGNTTGSMNVPTALSVESGGLGEATMARALASRLSLRSQRSSNSRLSRMSSARDGAGEAGGAGGWDLGDIREEDAEGTNAAPGGGASVGHSSQHSRDCGAAAASVPRASDGGGRQAALRTLSGKSLSPGRPAPVAVAGEEEQLVPAWKVLGAGAAPGLPDTSAAGRGGSGGGAGGEAPGSLLSTPGGSGRRSFRSQRSNSLGSSRLSRMTSQLSEALEDIVEEGAEAGLATGAVAAADKAAGRDAGDADDSDADSIPQERTSAGRAPPPAPSAGAARIGVSPANALGDLAPPSQTSSAAAETASDAEGQLLPAWKVLAPTSSDSPMDPGAVEADRVSPSAPPSALGVTRRPSLRSLRSGSMGQSRLSRMTSDVDERAVVIAFAEPSGDAGQPPVQGALQRAAVPAEVQAVAVVAASEAALQAPSAGLASAFLTTSAVEVEAAKAATAASGTGSESAILTQDYSASTLTFANMALSSRYDRNSGAPSSTIAQVDPGTSFNLVTAVAQPQQGSPAAPAPMQLAATVIREEDHAASSPSNKPAPGTTAAGTSPVSAGAEAAAEPAQAQLPRQASQPAPAPPTMAPLERAASEPQPVQRRRSGFLSCFACFGGGSRPAEE